MSKQLNSSQWRKLLDLTLTAVDTLPEGTPWTWGGGTAIAVRIDHRVSFDIDIFLTDTAALQHLYPRNNDVVKAITNKWQQPGNYLKLERKEGEIDFIVSQQFTEPGFTPWPHGERNLPLETLAEVAAKKLHWRGSKAVARDVYDMASIWLHEPESLRQAIGAAPEGAAHMADTIRRLLNRLRKELPLAIAPTENTEAILDLDLLELASVLSA